MKETENLFIRRAADCNIKAFIACLFDEDYHVLTIAGTPEEADLQKAFQDIYVEYLDLSGTAKSQELGLLKAIQRLHIRIKTIESCVFMQRVAIKMMDEPFTPGFALLSKYGHRLYWNNERPDKESILQKLVEIEAKEQRYTHELDRKVKELEALKQNNTRDTPADPDRNKKSERKAFISLMNNLQKHGFPIDKDKTTVEEFALMIRDYFDEVQRAITEAKNKRNGR